MIFAQIQQFTDVSTAQHKQFDQEDDDEAQDD